MVSPMGSSEKNYLFPRQADTLQKKAPQIKEETPYDYHRGEINEREQCAN
jgi:hypothetical protein